VALGRQLSLLFWRLVDLIKSGYFSQTLGCQSGRDGCSQRGFTVVNVTHGSDVDVWLIALEFCL